MITIRNVSKSFGAQTLFEDISLQINQDDRFALVGPNGAGKSTLFKIIMGTEQPDNGEVALRSGITFGFLPQETPHLSGKTALEETLGDDTGDFKKEAQAKKILMGLGFRVTDFTRSVQEFSGGWQMRVMIAKLLVQEPDLLMLDEPTNHLDLESLLWFQNYLMNYRGAIFLISHDRTFINTVCDRIIELRDHNLKIYTGTFEDYLDQRKKEEEELVQAYKRQQKEIEDLELFINRFRAKASLAASVQSKIKYLEKMEKIVLPPEQKTVGFSFPQPTRSGQISMDLKDISQSYDGKTFIYNKMNLTLERGQKIALVGPNGAGKSTLIKLLAGQIPFQSGERKLGFNVEVGYFSQHRAEMFTPNRTVFQIGCETRRAISETTIRTVLGSFLFQGDAVFKKTEVLSGGEKSRLGLARLLLDPPNVMLMDEPTTHLDMASVETLVEALKAFEGTLCFISHDVYFIRQLADHIIHVNQGKITWYPGNYDYFLHKKALEEGEEGEIFRLQEKDEQKHKSHNETKPEQSEKKSGGKKTKEQKRLEAEERNARYRASQENEKKGGQLNSLKTEEENILNILSDPASHSNPQRIAELSKQLGEIQRKLNELQK
ncbi:MAG: ATP-binding cassette domain-containing protein [Elusimicrobiota bacterium]